MKNTDGLGAQSMAENITGGGGLKWYKKKEIKTIFSLKISILHEIGTCELVVTIGGQCSLEKRKKLKKTESDEKQKNGHKNSKSGLEIVRKVKFRLAISLQFLLKNHEIGLPRSCFSLIAEKSEFGLDTLFCRCCTNFERMRMEICDIIPLYAVKERPLLEEMTLGAARKTQIFVLLTTALLFSFLLLLLALLIVFYLLQEP